MSPTSTAIVALFVFLAVLASVYLDQRGGRP